MNPSSFSLLQIVLLLCANSSIGSELMFTGSIRRGISDESASARLVLVATYEVKHFHLKGTKASLVPSVC